MKPDEIQFQFYLNYPKKQAESFSLHVDCAIPSTGVTAIFGPSGSGKTSLLRCMAGLEHAPKGHFQLAQEIWQDDSSFMPVHKRQQGFVFQEASLFSHLSVKGNLDYAVKRVAKRAGKRKQRKDEGQVTCCVDYQQVLELLGIANLLHQYPASLSGGEKQRVAIARALLSQPRILFMDEPLASLDFKRKQEVLPYLESLSQAFSIPIIYITHSLDEVARLADHMLVMEAGRVIANGPLEEVLARLDLPIYMEHDQGVVLKAKVLEKDSAWHLMKVSFEGGMLWLRDSELKVGDSVRVRVLAKDVSISLNKQDSSILNCLPACVLDILDDEDKAMALVRLELGEQILIAKLTKRSVDHLSLVSGLKVWAQIKSVAILP